MIERWHIYSKPYIFKSLLKSILYYSLVKVVGFYFLIATFVLSYDIYIPLQIKLLEHINF